MNRHHKKPSLLCETGLHLWLQRWLQWPRKRNTWRTLSQGHVRLREISQEGSPRKGKERPKQTNSPQEAISAQPQVTAIITKAKEGGDTVLLVEIASHVQSPELDPQHLLTLAVVVHT